METGRQTTPHELSRWVAWERLEVKEATAQLLGLGHFVVDKLQNFFENFGAVGNGDRGFEVDVANGHFGLLNSIPSTAKTGFRHKRMGVQDILQLGRRDLVALVLDEIFLAVGQPDIALIVNATNVTGTKPAVIEREDLCVGSWVLFVATGSVRKGWQSVVAGCSLLT